jgi:RNA polymerase sigma-70 factor (ECF subfamily)
VTLLAAFIWQAFAPLRETSSHSRESGGRLLDAERLPDHSERLFRAAYALCGSVHDAEDLVQETYASVLRRPRFIRRDDDLGYLLRALRNTWRAMHRRRAARPSTVELRENIEWVVDHGASRAETILELREAYAAIGDLSRPLRDAIIAVDIVGLSYRQAAQALRVREGTVMSRLSRARAQVIERLEGSAA